VSGKRTHHNHHETDQSHDWRGFERGGMSPPEIPPPYRFFGLNQGVRKGSFAEPQLPPLKSRVQKPVLWFYDTII
jgi:hypothetical protein